MNPIQALPDDFIGHMIQKPYCSKKKNTSKTFSEMAEQIEVKLYTYDRLSMRNKRFTHYDVISHMVWQPYWIYPKA